MNLKGCDVPGTVGHRRATIAHRRREPKSQMARNSRQNNSLP